MKCPAVRYLLENPWAQCHWDLAGAENRDYNDCAVFLRKQPGDQTEAVSAVVSLPCKSWAFVSLGEHGLLHPVKTVPKLAGPVLNKEILFNPLYPKGAASRWLAKSPSPRKTRRAATPSAGWMQPQLVAQNNAPQVSIGCGDTMQGSHVGLDCS